MRANTKLIWLTFLFFTTSAVGQKNFYYQGKVEYQQVSGLWGYTAPDSNEYAIVCTYNGLSIVDLNTHWQPRELFFVDDSTETAWREVKVYDGYAYSVGDLSGGDGLLIVDLHYLPDTITVQRWRGFKTAHTIFIDENGLAYLNSAYGIDTNIIQGVNPTTCCGILILDLKLNPFQPVYVGNIPDAAHDSYARNDTVWTANIRDGIFEVFDATDKNNITLIASSETPARSTHNTWLSDDGRYLFTTDEAQFGVVSSFDITDLGNIKLLDTYPKTVNEHFIPHNTHVLGNFLVNSNYDVGVTIVDATYPDNLVQVGYFDTSPWSNGLGGGGISKLCWEVYPYFPSGLIIASQLSEGLILLYPIYKQACYLEGSVSDEATQNPIANATIKFADDEFYETTDFLGNYKTGIADSGSYDIKFSAPGCIDKYVTSVLMDNGQITTLNVSLSCPYLSDGVKEAEYVSVHPNPATDFITIEGLHQPNTFQLYDYIGREVLNQQLSTGTNRVEINNLTNGIYVYRLTEEMKVGKVFIEK